MAKKTQVDSAKVQDSATANTEVVMDRKDKVVDRKKSSWATLKQGNPETMGRANDVSKLVSQTSYFMFFLLKTYCSNKHHTNKSGLEESMSKLGIDVLKDWRNYLFQNVSHLELKQDATTGEEYHRRELNSEAPEWSDIPESLRDFLESHIEETWNTLLLAKQLTQAMPEVYSGPVQFSTTTAVKMIKNDERYSNAICWWATVGYPNLSEIESDSKRAALMELYENKTRYPWWATPNGVLRYADQ